MLRVLFIDAENPVSKLSQRFAPLWPAYLAAHLESQIGADRFKFRLSNGKIENEFKSFSPHVAAISSVTKNYKYAVEYARIAKKKGLPVVIGGIHISFMPHSLTEDMDVGCIGEGEETFAELIRLYSDSGRFDPKDLAKINGICYWDNGKLISTPQRSLIATMDQISHPKRSLLGFRNTDTMMTARGCPYRCAFCSVSRYWKKVRYASVDYVIDEINELIENGVRIIKIYDDLFTSNQKRLMQFAERIHSNGLERQLKFTCWCRANTITQDVVNALKKMNVVSVELGLESGCNRILRYLKGNVDVNDNYKAIELLKNAGIQTNATFIVGSPDETEAEIMLTYDFIKNSRLDTVTVNLLIPFPGTPIWEYALKRKLVSKDMDWSQINNTVISEIISAQQLRRILKKFERLCLIKRLRALPKSPWLQEAPKVVYKRMLAKLFTIVRQ